MFIKMGPKQIAGKCKTVINRIRKKRNSTL